jgi:hypothetical protein
MTQLTRSEYVFTKHKVDKTAEKLEEHRIGIVDLYQRLAATHRYAQEVEKELCELREVVKQLTQRKERFQHNLLYVEVIEEIITNEGTEWEGKQFNNMLVRLVGRPDEVYKIFVSAANTPAVGDSVNFIFNADDNKLSKLRIIKPNE